jgi:hypothetical protein
VLKKTALEPGRQNQVQNGKSKVERKEMQGMRLFYRLVLMLALSFSFGGRNCDYPHLGGS